MNDTTNYAFSFSYDVPASQPASQVEPELLIFDDCHVFQLPDNRVLVRGKRTGNQTLLTNDVLYSLHQCDSFRTLEQHIKHLATSIPELEGQEADIRQILTSVQQAGLMVSARELAASLSLGTPVDQAQQSTSLCILTCARPDALERLLDSMQGRYDFRSDDTHHIIDDSRESDLQARNRAVVEAFNQQSGNSVIYFGPEEQAQFQQKLESRLPDQKAAIDFLIGRYEHKSMASYGRSRNLALLLSVDRALIFLDDDIVFHKHHAPYTELTPRISPLPRDAEFYSDNQEWDGYADDNTANPAAEFTQMLGCTLEQALATLEQQDLPQEQLSELKLHDLPMLHKDSRILVAGCGTYGDPGMASNGWIYEINPDARKKLLRSESFYQEARTRRNIWSGRHSINFSPRFVLISQMTGLDNTALLPPYFPLFRNEDFLFGDNLQFLHPRGLMVDFPWAMPHLPMEERKWDKNSIDRPTKYGMLDFTADYLASRHSTHQPTNPSLHLQLLSGHFKELGALNENSLSQLIKDETTALQSSRIQRLDGVLSEAGEAPDYWLKDVHKIIAANQSGLTEAQDEIFPFCLKEIHKDERLQHAQQLWRQFAESLAGWEDIRHAAQSISAEK